MQNDVTQSGHSASSGDLISVNYKKDTTEAIARWNPFEDSTPFNQVVTEEEDLFGAEFDKIRQEGESDNRIDELPSGFCTNPKVNFENNFFLVSGTKSLERLEHPTIPEDPFQAPFSLRQQRALKKNGSLEVEGKVCI